MTKRPALSRAIQARLIRRARGVLEPRGLWPPPAGSIPWTALCASLAQSLPGAIADYEIDHIVPLAIFDLADPKQLRAAFSVDNQRWLERGVNRSKGHTVDLARWRWLLRRHGAMP